jgi:hypothetical protein
LGEHTPQLLGRGLTAQNPDPSRDATRDAHADPSFIMIDIDRKDFPSDKAFQRALLVTIRKIREIFLLEKDAHPCTIIDTGGGAHFLIPLECDPAKFDAPIMHKKEDIVPLGVDANEFLRFCNIFFTNGRGDHGFFASVNSTMVRCPSGINSKYKGNKAIVRYIKKWDGKTKGHILCLLGEFHRYQQQKQQQQKRKFNRIWSTTYSVLETGRARPQRTTRSIESQLQQQYWYIQELLEFGIEDFRKRAISLLLAPWCINVKKMDHDSAERMLLDWIDKCQVVKPLDFDAYRVINQALNFVEARRQYLPLGLFKVKDLSPELYNKLTTAAATQMTDDDDKIHKEIRSK